MHRLGSLPTLLTHGPGSAGPGPDGGYWGWDCASGANGGGSGLTASDLLRARLVMSPIDYALKNDR